ncbi:MAG TPA: hypothetical protein VM843_08175 [Flavisolibacter sp.]|jgi:DNA-binding NarL/FixJ family response regulator|nr:hypothetical protein [Flavisolibacter sp.]
MEKKWNIVHLEDHRLYQRGMQSALNSLQGNLCFRSFQHPDAALQYTVVALARKNEIHLVITDFTQVSGNGYAFASGVRQIEQRHSLQIPIILLSMLEPERAVLIQRGIEEKIFDRYLCKDADPEKVLATINELVHRNNTGGTGPDLDDDFVSTPMYA